ncbi:MAG: heparinase II/III family protein [Paenirhodobacter sp.]
MNRTGRGPLVRALDSLAARRAARGQGATGFVSHPEPRTIGSFARGRQLLAGNFQFAGYLVEGPGLSIWDLPMPDPRFEQALHGFGWLDDLSAVGDGIARERARAWVFDWIARYGRGEGPGWTPELTGRRLMRMINHALLVMSGIDRPRADLFFRTLGGQTRFLSRRWRSAPEGLARFEALTGLIHAGLSLTGMAPLALPAAGALALECATRIDAQGGIASRNPEELLEVFSLLIWASDVLTASGRSPAPEHFHAIARIAPTLRALRHADGGLARFHGGGRGAEGKLDGALAASGSRKPAPEGPAMGFVRLHAGRTSVIVDAAPPPAGASAHASTLAFELTSGRRPLIVNSGSGVLFGPEWHLAGRATSSHSTLALDGYSSARLGPARKPGARLDEAPREVWCRPEADPARHALFGHDGYVATHGLSHIRELELTPDGGILRGSETLGAMSTADRRRFDAVFVRAGLRGMPFKVHFHLHPDVDATLDMGGWAVSMALRTGEIWVFRFDGPVEMALLPSVYLDKTRLRPRPAKQIVLSGALFEHAVRIDWTLERAQVTPAAIRDSGAMPLPFDI